MTHGTIVTLAVLGIVGQVLGGLLIADEVIDVFLPVLYFAVQKRRWAKVHRVNLWNGR